MLYASTLRPQDVEFTHVIGLTKALEQQEEVAKANIVRLRQEKGCELLVCHEPPDAAGTGVVVAHRVRTLNAEPDGLIRYYVYPVEGKEIEIIWQAGLPVVKCPAGAFGDVIDRLKPSKVEYHHLLRWPLDILNAPVPKKELWLHDSFLWCARYHSVHREGYVCNEPSPKKCADCSGESVEFLEKKKAYLVEALPKMGRYIANSAYTAKYAQANLSILCETIIPSGAPLTPYPKKKRVGYFGGFGVVKGTPVLLKAWRMLGGVGQLLMFCDVPVEWRTGRKLAGFTDVLVMGSYHRSDLPDLCNLVDLAVVPSINESYGMVKRELESLGVRVIATVAGGMDGDVPAGDAESIAEAIRAAL
jgi:glycosyltransferase involved in cell wall biosynthesis